MTTYRQLALGNVKSQSCRRKDEATPALSAAGIAKATNSDPVLIRKLKSRKQLSFLQADRSYHALSRSMVSSEEDGSSEYLSTTASKTFASPRNEAAMESCFDLLGPAWINLPQHLEDLKYQNPEDPRKPLLERQARLLE
jgi:hypothetical protein